MDIVGNYFQGDGFIGFQEILEFFFHFFQTFLDIVFEVFPFFPDGLYPVFVVLVDQPGEF